MTHRPTRALITGGTSGIGAAFARALAGRGVDLVLVARDADRLSATAGQLRTDFGVEVEVLVADLSDRHDVDRVAARLEDGSADPVDLLVNNAGFGLPGDLVDPDQDLHDRAFEVMVRAVMVLSAAAARTMRTKGGGTIINVSSTAGWVLLGNYSAIKAWVTTYTEALAGQLRGTGVTATALAPGWVHTEFHERAGINASRLPSAVWIDPQRVVDDALRDAAAGRPVSIPTPQWSAAIGLARHLPRPVVRWVSRKLGSHRG